MLQNHGHIVQTLLGTLFTWGMTAAGAGLVVIFNGKQQKLLDASLGFAAGVMIAASYWSLLDPAIEMAEQSKLYGENGEYSFVPVSLGFLAGAVFVCGTDIFISSIGVGSSNIVLALTSNRATEKKKLKSDGEFIDGLSSDTFRDDSTTIEGFSFNNANANPLSRRRVGHIGKSVTNGGFYPSKQIGDISDSDSVSELKQNQWKRMLLLIVAITVHNIPEGLAVGVGFGAIGSSASATFENARNLAIGIGIQNFPEGLAVSLPLKMAGFSTWKSFWYGQLSGMVEPVFGLLGAAAVSLAQPVLPYALAFAAGAMIYVVVDDIIPEANASGNGKLASWGTVVGFIVMMALDVGLG